MRSSKHYSLALVPLLSILAMSPSVIQTKYASRSIANVGDPATIEVSKLPLYEALAKKADPKLIKVGSDMAVEDFKKWRSDLKAKIDQRKVDSNTIDIDVDVIEIISLEKTLASFKEQGCADEILEKETNMVLAESKEIIENILPREKSLEVASEEKEVKVAEEKKEEKKEEKTEEKKEEEASIADLICDLQEKNVALNTQIEKLISDQSLIMQNMMMMTQVMLGMFQQQQQSRNGIYGFSPVVTAQAYQYNQPTTAGNWVYYPSGFQPNQSNIFSVSNQAPGGFYPDQVHQGSPAQQGSGWNLNPTQSFVPGTFGNDVLSFNLSNSVPTVSQL